ncbi:VMAP-C domain-containing protein [Nostoc sphaeroides]|uniref:VMAP-C domain-containing protein n=1 Tax=Nostoc sphaeroides TaxID=446679 RepID=UPI0022641753|nr:hypothetical protein [Nostoc sphaeroides]
MIPDNQVPLTDSHRYQPISNISTQYQKKYFCKEEIPGLVNEFVKHSNKYLNNLIETKNNLTFILTIEIFLPSKQLISTESEVGRWIIRYRSNDFPLVTRHSIFVRSSERQTPDYRDECLNEWRNNWDRVKKLLDNASDIEVFEHLKQLDDDEWSGIVKNFSALGQTQNIKIGFMISCLIPESKQEDLFNALDNAAVPIALWTRYDTTNLDHSDRIRRIDDLLKSCPLRYLPKYIHEQQSRNYTTGKKI